MKWVQKMMAVFLMVLLIIVLTASNTIGFAEYRNEQVTPRYSYTREIAAGLSINSSGVATCYGEIVVYDLDNELDLSVRLQRKEGNVWVLVKKWTASADGGRDLYIDKTYTVTEGTYRVIATGLVITPDGDIETCSCTTSQRTYP